MKTCVICKSPSADTRDVLCAAHVDEWLRSPEGRRAMESFMGFAKFNVTDGKVDPFSLDHSTPIAATMFADFVRRKHAERLNGSTR